MSNIGQIMAECDCQHTQCETLGYCMAARIEELEAKLAKAVEALSLYSCEDGCNDCPDHERDRVSCGWTARAALASIKGDKTDG